MWKYIWKCNSWDQTKSSFVSNLIFGHFKERCAGWHPHAPEKEKYFISRQSSWNWDFVNTTAAQTGVLVS